MRVRSLHFRSPVVVPLLLVALALPAAACGVGDAQTSKRPPHASVSATTAGAARLPVVACPTGETPDLAGRPLKRDAQWVWILPQHLPRYVPAPAGVSARFSAHLARYEGDLKHARDMNVLAPRGWKCSAHIPEDGNWDMTVGPAQGRLKERIRVAFYWAGAGFGAACRYFKSARAGAPDPALCNTPAHTTVLLRTSSLVTTVTAPAGNWTTFPARSFLYWHPKGPPGAFAEGASCVRPAADRRFCEAILGEAQRREGDELARPSTSRHH